jgi:catechol 2,3-dioxygenase-like lactoylglutathione lyase family enzyme
MWVMISFVKGGMGDYLRNKKGEFSMAVKLTGVHHCSIMVSDLGRAAKFYRDVMQLKEIPTPSTFPAANMRVRWFELGDQQVHLMSGGPDKVGPRHFALHVEDAKKAREHFKRHGIEVRETIPIPGADRFFVSDPDGNNIEIMQWFTRWPEGDEAAVRPPE